MKTLLHRVSLRRWNMARQLYVLVLLAPALFGICFATPASAGITFNDLTDGVTIGLTADCHGFSGNETESAFYSTVDGDCIPPLSDLGEEVFIIESTPPVAGRLTVSDTIIVNLRNRVDFASDPDPPFVTTIDPAMCNAFQIHCVVEDGTVQDISTLLTSFGAPLPAGSISFSSDVDPTVPEPASILLLGIGLAGIGFARRRRLH